jgi:hypothetical protein
MVHLEDPQPSRQVVPAAGERVQARAQDHVLAGAPGNGLLHDVLGKPGPHAHPAAEGQQVRLGHLGLQPTQQHQPLPPGQAQGQVVVQDPGLRFLTVQGPGHSGQHRGAARTPNALLHATIVATRNLPAQPPARRRDPAATPGQRPSA